MKKDNIIGLTKNSYDQAFIDLGGFQVGYFINKANDKLQNDDSLLIHPINESLCLFAIADGVGAAKNAHHASQSILHCLVAAINKHKKINSLAEIRNIILDCIFTVNSDFSAKKGYLTTLTLCVVHHNTMQVFQIGDSGILLFGQRGKLRYKTTSHSPVGYAQEAGLLDNASAIEHPDNHYIYNLIGDGNLNVEISSPLSLLRRDTVLLASDGLYDNILLKDLVNYIRCKKTESVTRQLSECIKKQVNPVTGDALIKEDDVSFIIVRFNACLFNN